MPKPIIFGSKYPIHTITLQGIPIGNADQSKATPELRITSCRYPKLLDVKLGDSEASFEARTLLLAISTLTKPDKP